jgi:hypothetical protein
MVIGISLSACGGNPAAPRASSGPNGPTIANLTATFLAGSCTREFPGNRGVTGTTLVTGATSGQVRVGGCPRYNDAAASTETVWLYDANNHVSNSLTVTVTRPAGAP